jgi:hypothetical protein
MERGRGKQFDPQVLKIFLREKIYKSGRCRVPTVDENIRNGNRYDDGSN